ncbi:hypothetical protein NPL7_02395 [Metamycoplasma hyosynoviae]|uniref:hypothetical protein n=1 Tax=Metamycoplasma hyosynoviae TaxID=29559 RepID=UPI00046191A9|nr:hypothetical protein [Metamycoplasma hyosynoviae]KDE41672.1 hypothetical protein NPL7_02395 [Metamycoplasma hyosynoviae]
MKWIKKLSLPLFSACSVPLVVISCKQKDQLDEPKDDKNYSFYKQALNNLVEEKDNVSVKLSEAKKELWKLKKEKPEDTAAIVTQQKIVDELFDKKLAFIKNLNIYADPLKSSGDLLKEWDPTYFVQNIIYQPKENFQDRIKKIRLNDDSQFYKELKANNLYDEFHKKYKIIIVVIDNQDKLSVTFQLTLMPLNSSYSYKGKKNDYYFFYNNWYARYQGFKGEEEIVTKQYNTNKTFTILGIVIPVVAIGGLIIYIVVMILVKKSRAKRGLK